MWVINCLKPRSSSLVPGSAWNALYQRLSPCRLEPVQNNQIYEYRRIWIECSSLVGMVMPEEAKPPEVQIPGGAWNQELKLFWTVLCIRVKSMHRIHRARVSLGLSNIANASKRRSRSWRLSLLVLRELNRRRW